jgi:glutamate synthase domain-containing protein 3
LPVATPPDNLGGIGPDTGSDVPVIVVSEIREYPRINAELAQRLDQGHTRVRLAGAEGQRLLLAGLAGSWNAVVEIEGHAGPELAAELDAPGLTVVCRGAAEDGAGRGLRSGRLLILGRAGDAVGYTQTGGSVAVSGPAGHRAGLDMAGGTLLLLGEVGRLAGERQTGGRLFARTGRLGPYAGHAHRGGRLIVIGAGGVLVPPAQPEDQLAYHTLLEGLSPWLTEESPSIP